MVKANNISVSIAQYSTKREWNCRIEWVGLGLLLSIGVNKAPALRIVVFGISFWIGKIPSPINCQTTFFPLEESK